VNSLQPNENRPPERTEADHGQCRICMLVRDEYTEAGLVAHLANTHGTLTADDEVRQVLIQLLDATPSKVGEPARALLQVLDRCDTYRSTQHHHEALVSSALIADIRAVIAAEFGVDERPAGRELPRSHVNAVLASHPGPKALFIARSTTGWVGWAGPASGGPKDGMQLPLPIDPEHPARHIQARRMAQWWLERHDWAVDDVWTGLRFEAATAPIRPVPVSSNTTHPEEDHGGH
jgi:hypothetical protein